MDTKKHVVAVTALIKNQAGDKFLILKRGADEIAFPGKWAFPGGKAERGERLIDVLRREAKEEAGLELEAGDHKIFLKDYTFVRPDDQNVIGMSFLVRATSDAVVLGRDFSEFKWITPAELAQFDHIEGMAEEVRLAFAEERVPAAIA